MQKLKQGFTLVELIVVVSILAILSTIGFVSYSSYITGVRDTNRIAQISAIHDALEVYRTKRDLPLPDDKIEIQANGDTIAYQGYLGKSNLETIEYNKGGKDPKDDTYFSYYLTKDKKYFQLMALLEDEESFSTSTTFQIPKLTPQTYAALDYTNRYPYVLGNKLGILTDEDNTPVQEIETLQSAKKLDIATATGTYHAHFLPEEYASGTGIITYKLEEVAEVGGKFCGATETKEIYFSGALAGGDDDDKIEVYLITSTDCSSAGWIWVDETEDVYIGSSRGDGFCISPRFGDWGDSSDGTDGISFNGWGRDTSLDYYNGWDASSIDDRGNLYSSHGQTRILDSEVSYNCKALGTASSDFVTSDTIVGRMKWLATTGNTYGEAQDIDWITGVNPVNGHAVPALFVADCIDGVKDLGTTMTYTHNDDSTDEVTYAEYSTDVTLNTDTAYLSDTTYQNRQKYLTAWTQESGSHLPSAFSYINDGNAGPCNGGIDCDNLSVATTKGEYQVACEANLLTYANDNTDNEWIWLSAIGRTSGNVWGTYARVVGYNGCGTQGGTNTGTRYGNFSARFVVRP